MKQEILWYLWGRRDSFSHENTGIVFSFFIDLYMIYTWFIHEKIPLTNTLFNYILNYILANIENI